MSDQAKLILTGNIVKIHDTVVSNGFQKRQILLKENIDSYPQTWGIDFIKDDVHSLDAFKEGQTVECYINLRGNFYCKDGIEKAFNSLQCWRIKKIADTATKDQSVPEPVEYTSDPANMKNLAYNPVVSNDELPF